MNVCSRIAYFLHALLCDTFISKNITMVIIHSVDNVIRVNRTLGCSKS